MSGMHEFNRKLIDEFRANGGKVGGQFAKMPVLLLTMTGAKSGQSRTTPLVYSKDGDRIVLIASMGGAPNNPDWYHNLLAHPAVEVEIGAERIPVRATVAKGEERERLFNAQARQMPIFAEYQKKTTRQIPVFVLERVR